MQRSCLRTVTCVWCCCPRWDVSIRLFRKLPAMSNSGTTLSPSRHAMMVADRDFNHWMLGAKEQEFERNPLRFAENWRSVGDLLARNLTAGFYGAYSHESDEGLVRVFDPIITPGMDIWTWGFPPPPERQRQYSLTPNLGYVEMW